MRDQRGDLNPNWRGGKKPNPRAGKRGPDVKPGRDGDKKQARARVNRAIRLGEMVSPKTLPCADCGHVFGSDQHDHEYDHYLGYDAIHHMDVQAVCVPCHVARDSAMLKKTSCKHGHPFDEENTGRNPNGTRYCRACRREFDRQKRVRPPGYWKAVNDRRRMKK